MRFRLVITQGPVQSLVASAVTRFLEDQGSHLQSILVAGGFASESRSLVEATLACAAWGAWKGTLHVDDAVDGAIDEGLPDPAEVEEVLCVRNWQAVNERLLDRYRDAHRIAYGDGLGVIDLVRAPGQPAVDEVVAPVPQVEREGALDGLAVRMVPAAYLHESIAAVRTAEPGLVSLDDEMARYAEGGVVALTGNLTEAGLTTYPRELAHFRGLIEIAASAPSAIVVKGHPRATLAQATGLARLMRARGHQTRVLLHERYGSFPIETFPARIRSAATVQAGWSSAAV